MGSSKKAEQERIKTLLKETIMALCRNGLPYSSQFCVEGLLGITLDESDIFLINIKEEVCIEADSGRQEEEKDRHSNRSSSITRQVHRDSSPVDGHHHRSSKEAVRGSHTRTEDPSQRHKTNKKASVVDIAAIEIESDASSECLEPAVSTTSVPRVPSHRSVPHERTRKESYQSNEACGSSRRHYKHHSDSDHRSPSRKKVKQEQDLRCDTSSDVTAMPYSDVNVVKSEPGTKDYQSSYNMTATAAPPVGQGAAGLMPCGRGSMLPWIPQTLNPSASVSFPDVSFSRATLSQTLLSSQQPGLPTLSWGQRSHEPFHSTSPKGSRKRAAPGDLEKLVAQVASIERDEARSPVSNTPMSEAQVNYILELEANILRSPGSFVSARVVRRRCQKYNTGQIVESMIQMTRSQDDSLYVGEFRYVKSAIKVFYKCPPTLIKDEALQRCGLTREEYKEMYDSSAKPSSSAPSGWDSYLMAVLRMSPFEEVMAMHPDFIGVSQNQELTDTSYGMGDPFLEYSFQDVHSHRDSSQDGRLREQFGTAGPEHVFQRQSSAMSSHGNQLLKEREQEKAGAYPQHSITGSREARDQFADTPQDTASGIAATTASSSSSIVEMLDRDLCAATAQESSGRGEENTELESTAQSISRPDTSIVGQCGVWHSSDHSDD